MIPGAFTETQVTNVVRDHTAQFSTTYLQNGGLTHECSEYIVFGLLCGSRKEMSHSIWFERNLPGHSIRAIHPVVEA